MLTYGPPLAHNIITTNTIETSKNSLLAAMQWEALLSSAIAREISNQKANKISQSRSRVEVKNIRLRPPLHPGHCTT